MASSEYLRNRKIDCVLMRRRRALHRVGAQMTVSIELGVFRERKHVHLG